MLLLLLLLLKVCNRGLGCHIGLPPSEQQRCVSLSQRPGEEDVG